MKTRRGFVSNSSATSFGVYGICIDDVCEVLGLLGDKPEIKITKTQNCLHVFDRDKCNFCPECGLEPWTIERTDPWGDYPHDELIDQLDNIGLDLAYMGENGYAVGIDIKNTSSSKIAEDNFVVLKNAKETILKIFGEDPTFICGSDYDG